MAVTPGGGSEGDRADGAVALRFATGRIGCALPMLAACALLFGILAARPDLAEHRTRIGRLMLATQYLDVGSVNPVVLGFALVSVYGFILLGSQWSDGIAVAAGTQGLRFHWSLLRRRTVGWDEVRGARIVLWRGYAAETPQLIVDLVQRSIVVRPIDMEGDAATRLVAFIEAHAAARPEPHS